MSALEYLLQDLVLTEPECNTINSKIIHMFNHKIHLPTTAINSGIYMHTGYKIFNIYNRQLELHSKNLLNRLNSDNICRWISNARLQHLQNLFWSTQNVTQYINNSKPKDI